MDSELRQTARRGSALVSAAAPEAAAPSSIERQTAAPARAAAPRSRSVWTRPGAAFRRAALLLAAGTAGCGPGARPCDTPEATLAEGSSVTCAEVQPIVDLTRVLAARPLQDGQRRGLYDALAAAAVDRPDALRERAKVAAATLQPMVEASGFRAATLRSQAIAHLHRADGALPTEGWAEAAAQTLAAVAVWERAEDQVLTEVDIEGLLRLASLCREAQGGTPLRISIADRVSLYQLVRDRFRSGDASQRSAMLSVGPFWPDIRIGWQMASYEVQQRWIASAPLPPPMVTDSAGYVAAVLDGDLAGIVLALHDALGTLKLDGAPRRSATAPPATPAIGVVEPAPP